MLRRSLLQRARRKHGQRAWSPNASSSGAAPATGLTMQEALQVAYRPMPPAQTVEYEEDFGRNMLIHREFVSKKYRNQMAFDMASMAYSEVELRKGQQRLADAMNRERRGVLVGSAGTENDRVFFNADLGENEQPGGVESARFLFNEQRMQYCDRFQERMRVVSKRLLGVADPAKEDAEDSQVLFSLMEACAIVHGCDTTAAKEAYFHMFNRLDLDSLEEDTELLKERQEDAATVREQLRALQQAAESGGDGVHGRGGDQVQQIIDSMPGLFDVVDEEKEHAEKATQRLASSEVDSVRDAAVPELDVPEAFAPFYKSYLAHARGETPLASHDPTPLVATDNLAERRSWRSVMDKLIDEDYASITASELKAAAKLDEQLHTIKFMDLKVGDTVKEIMALLQRETGDGSSVNRNTPLEVSEAHPERRV